MRQGTGWGWFEEWGVGFPPLPLRSCDSDDNGSATAFNFCHFPGAHLGKGPLGGRIVGL